MKINNEIVFQRKSLLVESAQLLSQFIMADLRCLAFCKARSVCELVFLDSSRMLRKADVDGYAHRLY